MGGRGWERGARGSESKRMSLCSPSECVLLSQISKESAEYMVEEYKRLRQRDSTGGSVAMATHCPMESVILTSFTYIYILSFPPFVLHSTLLSPFPPLPLPLRDHKVVMEDYCAPVGEHDTSVRGHGTPALHRGGQEITWQS